jgi:hypothetical protein
VSNVVRLDAYRGPWIRLKGDRVSLSLSQVTDLLDAMLKAFQTGLPSTIGSEFSVMTNDARNRITIEARGVSYELSKAEALAAGWDMITRQTLSGVTYG